MTKVPTADADLALTVDFCNTYDLLNDPPDRLTLDLVRRLARHHGRAELVSGLREADLPSLRTLRSSLYAVFAAPAGDPTIGALNQVLDAASARAQVLAGAQPRLAAIGGPAPLDALAAAMADALARAVVEGGTQRLRLCAGDPCRCVYVDRTRANRQRYCCELCNDRVASAAYRRRAGSGAAPGRPAG